jgi:hypothetical protein
MVNIIVSLLVDEIDIFDSACMILGELLKRIKHSFAEEVSNLFINNSGFKKSKNAKK